MKFGKSLFRQLKGSGSCIKTRFSIEIWNLLTYSWIEMGLQSSVTWM